MTQYPSPYQGPQWGGQQVGYYGMPGGPGGPEGSAAGKKAGILLYVLGGLSLLGGMCCGVGGSVFPQMMAERPDIMQQMPEGVSAETVRLGMLVAAGMGVVFGVAQVVLGRFVQKGSKGATIAALVVAGLAVLYFAFSAVVGMASGGAGACGAVVPLGLYVLLVVWLVQAVRAPAAVPAGAWPGAGGPGGVGGVGGTQGYPPGYVEAWHAHQRAYEEWARQQQQQGQQPNQQGTNPPPPPPPPPPAG